ncbi:YkvI family membrane protein [Dialister sp.]|uniref:YkvI family membrane protein n=1 Tax=Dialister sp. TaxID=1955814 RepID=UPI003EFE0791
MEKRGSLGKIMSRYVLPGIILQSVLIGGGYATGREIVEYGAKYGAMGWLSGFASFIGFSLMAILSFEMVRLFKLYDFKSLLKSLIGPFYHLFDVVYIMLMLIIIAVMSSATGAIVEQMTGLNYWVGVSVITVVVGILNFYGEKIIACFESVGTVLLYIGYISFSALVITQGSDHISQVMAAGDVSFTPDVTVLSALWTGILYVGYNLVVFPASFFTIKNQTSTKQSVIGGLIAGLLMTIPWFMTYFAIMAFYPDTSVLAAPVPWLVMMMADKAPSWLFLFFGLVMGWTLIETATGMIHAMLGRIDKGLADSGRSGMPRARRAQVTVAILAASAVLAKFGIIDLIAKGYNALSYAIIVLLLVPLLTVGLYKIVKREREIRKVEEPVETEEPSVAVHL